MAVTTLAELGAALTANAAGVATATSIAAANITALGQVLTDAGQKHKPISNDLVRLANATSSRLLSS